MNRILLPITFPPTTDGAAQQAAILARRFKAEIILLHVVAPRGHLSRALTHGPESIESDGHARSIARAKENLDQALRSELDGIAVRRLLLEGEPAHEILQTAQRKSVDLIAMATHSRGAVYRLLLGSVVAKVLHHTECAVWTAKYPDGERAEAFAIRHVLCAVDLTAHSRNTVLRAAQMAAEFGAHLSLVHITAGVEVYGPGGVHVDPQWQESLVGYATDELATLQRDLRIDADVIIDSGNVRDRLNHAVERTKGDILVIGHKPPGGHLGDNGGGYAIIRDSKVPVLSV
jgi:nucleotide-binding universal stress UspA family protein